MLPRLGLTGVQFINVANGCATGGSALLSGYWAIKSGEFDMGVVTGFDKHPRGAFAANPRNYGLPDWSIFCDEASSLYGSIRDFE